MHRVDNIKWVSRVVRAEFGGLCVQRRAPRGAWRVCVAVCVLLWVGQGFALYGAGRGLPVLVRRCLHTTVRPFPERFVLSKPVLAERKRFDPLLWQAVAAGWRTQEPLPRHMTLVHPATPAGFRAGLGGIPDMARLFVNTVLWPLSADRQAARVTLVDPSLGYVPPPMLQHAGCADVLTQQSDGAIGWVRLLNVFAKPSVPHMRREKGQLLAYILGQHAVGSRADGKNYAVCHAAFASRFSGLHVVYVAHHRYSCEFLVTAHERHVLRAGAFPPFTSSVTLFSPHQYVGADAPVGMPENDLERCAFLLSTRVRGIGAALPLIKKVPNTDAWLGSKNSPVRLWCECLAQQWTEARGREAGEA
jgi:hypothetical protein